MKWGKRLWIFLWKIPAADEIWKWIFSAVSPFVIGIGIAYLLDIPISFLEKRFLCSRKLAVLAGLALAALAVALFVEQLLPGLGNNIVILAGRLPEYYEKASAFLETAGRYTGLVPQSLLDTLEAQSRSVADLSRLAVELLGRLPDYLQEVWAYSVAIGSGFLRAITACISAVYMLLDKERLLSQARKAAWSLLSRRQVHWLMRVCEVANRMCKAFFEGKCIDSFVMGLLTLLVVGLLGLPYSGLLALVVGLTNIVPIAGPVVGGAVGVALLALEDPAQSFKFLAAILVLQQLDGKIIGPRILGDRIGLSTLWVLVALMVGSALAGVLGMVLGVPLLATVMAIGGEVMTQHRNERHASRIAVRILEEEEE